MKKSRCFGLRRVSTSSSELESSEDELEESSSSLPPAFRLLNKSSSESESDDHQNRSQLLVFVGHDSVSLLLAVAVLPIHWRVGLVCGWSASCEIK